MAIAYKTKMTDQIVVFTLDELLYALPLSTVVKVIHAIETRHLPEAPEIITGIINVKGQIIPVVDIRKRLELATHEIDPDDRLIIANTGKRHVAILVDTVTGIRDLAPGQQKQAKETLPFAEHLKGVAKIDDELILIYDLDRFLSLDEEKELEQALKTKNK
jgi:purine-binding chemotaxis protein CheW